MPLSPLRDCGSYGSCSRPRRDGGPKCSQRCQTDREERAGLWHDELVRRAQALDRLTTDAIADAEERRAGWRATRWHRVGILGPSLEENGITDLPSLPHSSTWPEMGCSFVPDSTCSTLALLPKSLSSSSASSFINNNIMHGHGAASSSSPSGADSVDTPSAGRFGCTSQGRFGKNDSHLLWPSMTMTESDTTQSLAVPPCGCASSQLPEATQQHLALLRQRLRKSSQERIVRDVASPPRPAVHRRTASLSPPRRVVGFSDALRPHRINGVLVLPHRTEPGYIAEEGALMPIGRTGHARLRDATAGMERAGSVPARPRHILPFTPSTTLDLTCSNRCGILPSSPRRHSGNVARSPRTPGLGGDTLELLKARREQLSRDVMLMSAERSFGRATLAGGAVLNV